MFWVACGFCVACGSDLGGVAKCDAFDLVAEVEC